MIKKIPKENQKNEPYQDENIAPDGFKGNNSAVINDISIIISILFLKFVKKI